MSRTFYDVPEELIELRGTEPWHQVSLLDLAVILHHLHVGARRKEVGFLDANHTLESITQRLNKRVWVKRSHLESGLFSCNLLNEVDAFDDVRGRPFNLFLKDVLGPGATFNPVYNWITKKGEDSND